MVENNLTKINSMRVNAEVEILQQANILFALGDKVIIPINKSKNKSDYVHYSLNLRAELIRALYPGMQKKIMKDCIPDREILTAVRLPGMILLKIGDKINNGESRE